MRREDRNDNDDDDMSKIGTMMSLFFVIVVDATGEGLEWEEQTNNRQHIQTSK